MTSTWIWVFRAGVVLDFLGSLLFFLGFFTDHWYDDGVVNYGLWDTCVSGNCERIDSNEAGVVHTVTQIFQVLAFVTYIMSSILHFLFYFCSSATSGWKTRIYDVGLFIGMLFHVVSIVVFGQKIEKSKYLDWSYVLSASSLAILFIGWVFMTFSRKNATKKFNFFKKGASSRVGVNSTNATPRPNQPVNVNVTVISDRPSGYPQHGRLPPPHNTFGPQEPRGSFEYDYSQQPPPSGWAAQPPTYADSSGPPTNPQLYPQINY